MYVIFPADELILMTYGAAIPRLAPRPTLDCLREPQVPNILRSNNVSNIKELPKQTTKIETESNLKGIPEPSPPSPEYPDYSIVHKNSLSDLPKQVPAIDFSQSPNALPSRRNTRSSIKSTNKEVTANHVNTLNTHSNQVNTFMCCNDINMYTSDKQKQKQQQQQQQQLQRQNAQTSDIQKNEEIDSRQLSLDTRYQNNTLLRYPTGALTDTRERSPSIFLERPAVDVTQPQLGPGWGRPMSPMELPPEPKSSTSKSRLRPKLHIPLGRLGRASSSDQRESHRLREDLQLHVENPIFNSENLRQRNFDAFFESGEPVYKLQPRSSPIGAGSASASTEGYQSLDSYAGVYESSPRSRRSPNAGRDSLFTSLSRNKNANMSRSRSVEQYEPAPEMHHDNSGGGVPQKDSSRKSSSGPRSRKLFGWRGPRGGSLCPDIKMASNNGVLKDCGQSSLNEALKSQNSSNFKLIKTVSDFTENLSQLYEEHATALQSLVTNYRKKSNELRKERPACHLTIFQAWETFLQEIETDSQAINDTASLLARQVSRPMIEKSFHRKVQSRKIFTHRESFETIIAKTEEKLSKCRLDYKQCYMSHHQNPTPHSMTEYIDAHNAYVQQLHATNAMLETYHCETIPQLLQELEDVHNDLYSILTDSFIQTTDLISRKAMDQAKRYNNLNSQCSSVSSTQDLINFVRILPLPPQTQKVPKWIFTVPKMTGEMDESVEYSDGLHIFRNELIFDRQSTLTLRPALESLKREAVDLEMQIRQLQETIDTLSRNQTRSIEGQLYNKANELQEDISMKKFDLRAKEIHLSAIRAQKELFLSKIDPGSPRADRKFSAAAAPPSMKTKWLKAFKSLKPTSGSVAQPERRNGPTSGLQGARPNEDGSHHLQEYTYKKITACDVCSQILRGHTRQGLRCRICKLNAHGDCASQLPRCQPKQKLLRRQKSTSELENRIDIEEEIDKSVQINKLDDGAPPDIPIVNIPENPERVGTATLGASGKLVSGRILGRGVRPQSVAMPILGVQLQQQELQQQRGALPVPTQDVSSSSVAKAIPPASAYTSSGVNMKYYASPNSYCYMPSAMPSMSSAAAMPLSLQKQQQQGQQTAGDSVQRRRLFAGFRPLSGFGRLRSRSSQHRSISLPEIADVNMDMKVARPFGEPLRLQKRILKKTCSGGSTDPILAKSLVNNNERNMTPKRVLIK